MVLSEATSKIREAAKLRDGSLSEMWMDLGELVYAVFPSFEQADYGVLVYMDIGRRLANLHMNHN